MRPLVPHYDSIYNTYRNLYDRRAFAHDVLDWYVWRGRNLKSLCSHIRNTDHRRRRREKSHGNCNGRGCVVFQMALSQCRIMGFYLMRNVGLFIWNEFWRTVGGRLHDSPQMRGSRSQHLEIRDKWALCVFLQLWGCSNTHGLADDQTNRNDHSPQKQLVSPELSKRQNINNSRN